LLKPGPESVRLRPLAEADLEAARRLRNANRQFFFFDGEVTPEQHQAWFRALAANPIDFFVIEDAGVVVGTVSANRWPNGVEIGNLLLDDAARGRGVMRRAVAELTAGPGHYFAKVKRGNTPSINVFLATGFTIASNADVVMLVKDV
jgi:RimJ/RimL family protein N-acetyltransferase